MTNKKQSEIETTSVKEAVSKKKSNRGRKSRYDEIVKPRLKEIIEWRKQGATDTIIAKKLGIGVSTIYDYQKKYPEFLEAFKTGTEELVGDLRGELIKLAFKHNIEMKKTYIKKEDGKDVKYTEITTKEVDGNVNALHLLLKNYDRQNWSNDWQNHELKQMELELRREIASQNEWK